MPSDYPKRAAVLGTALLLAFGIPGRGWSSMQVVGSLSAISFPNVRVSHDGFAAHAEPSLAVNPRNPHNLLGAAQLIETTRATAVLGTFASFDGGRTWRDNGPLPLPPGYTNGDDVTVAFTPRGTGIVAAEAYRRGGSAVFAWRTVDGGRSFSRPLAVYQVSSGNVNVDHPWVATDATSSRVYLAWSFDRTLLFSRSTDDGRSFAPPRTISSSHDQHPDWAVVTAGPRGIVHVVYVDESSDAPFEVVSSSDAGRTFASPQSPPGTRIAGDASRLSVSTLLAAATDQRDGTLYASRAAYLHTTGRLAVLLWRSADTGRGWSAPVRVDVGPGADQVDHFQPQVCVDGDEGVDVSYFTLVHGRVDVFLARSSTHGAGFGSSRRITSTSFDPTLGLQGGKGGVWWIGDYQGLAATDNTIYPFWNDTRTGHLEIFTAAVPTSTLH